MRRVSFQTLGCKLNQYETESLAGKFRARGYRVVGPGEPAEIRIINTCTVTNKADRKSRQAVYKAVQPGDPERVVVVTGCYVERDRSALEKDGVTYLIDNAAKSGIFDLVEAHYRGEILHPTEHAQGLFDYRPVDGAFHTRGMIKIQDGCNNFCTYCIIPFVRGQAVSRRVSQVMDELKQVLDAGTREVVLTGVNLGAYSSDGTNLSGLIEKITGVSGDFRVRISSLEPEGLDDRFFQIMGHPRICPHLHLCLQSGSDRTLLRMRRQYTVSEYGEIVDTLRGMYPDFNITTDIITGFPGETEYEFSETCRVIERLQFGHVHTFPYSRRTGTRADRLPDQIPEKVKTERSRVIREIAEQSRRTYRKRFIGKTEEVLLEKTDSAGLSGYGYGKHYIPVRVTGSDLEDNRVYPAQIHGIAEEPYPVLLAERIISAAPRTPGLTDP
jgi:threonylcarbamoyladenosine tRNA methylthiotransferase MtaB